MDEFDGASGKCCFRWDGGGGEDGVAVAERGLPRVDRVQEQTSREIEGPVVRVKRGRAARRGHAVTKGGIIYNW